MRIDVTVTLGDGDSFAYTAEAAAAQVIAALGGNPTTDYCQVVLSQNALGSSGVAPEPPANLAAVGA
jgi:hypothetical protein